jgi:hypothetical protein
MLAHSRPMSKASMYRTYAEKAASMAARSDDAHYKALMLQIAQDWLDLAEREEKQLPPSPPGVEARRRRFYS